MDLGLLAYVDGAFVPEREARVSVFDRCFRLGDGLFETVRVADGRLLHEAEHVARLGRSAVELGFVSPPSEAELRSAAEDLVARNRLTEASLRIQLSRGVGPPGYSPAGVHKPTVVITMHPLPSLRETGCLRVRLHTASLRLPAGHLLNGHKSASRLLNVLARAEAEAAGADEALLLDSQGHLAEAASANLFWIESDALHTPPLSTGALPGIARRIVLELGRRRGLTVRETLAGRDRLDTALGVFLTVSTRGVIEVTALDGHPVPAHPVTARLWEDYVALALTPPSGPA